MKFPPELAALGAELCPPGWTFVSPPDGELAPMPHYRQDIRRRNGVYIGSDVVTADWTEYAIRWAAARAAAVGQLEPDPPSPMQASA